MRRPPPAAASVAGVAAERARCIELARTGRESEAAAATARLNRYVRSAADAGHPLARALQAALEGG